MLPKTMDSVQTIVLKFTDIHKRIVRVGDLHLPNSLLRLSRPIAHGLSVVGAIRTATILPASTHPASGIAQYASQAVQYFRLQSASMRWKMVVYVTLCVSPVNTEPVFLPFHLARLEPECPCRYGALYTNCAR